MKTIITSRANPLIKEYAKLKNQKYVQKTGLVMLEGKRIVKDALIRGVEIQSIIYTDESFIEDCKKQTCKMIEVNESVFQTLAQTKNSQGIIAVVKWQTSGFEFPTTNFLVLDNVSDPGNFGTIIRTAVASNFMTIYTLNGVEPYNDKVLRSTMGTIFDCKIIPVSLEQLKQLSKQNALICADMGGEDVFSYTKSNKNFGIVLGNEGNGISEEVKSLCSATVSLPMQNDVESLNVAVAGGILMYILNR